MKWIVVLCLAFAIRTCGQTQEKVVELPPLEAQMTPTTESKLPNTLPSVVIESWHYDTVQKTLTLHLANRSPKDVTAFSISIAEKYADGSTDYADGRPNSILDHEMMQDMLGAVIQRQLMKADGRVGHGVVWAGAVAGWPRTKEPPVRYQDIVAANEGNGTFAAGTTHDYVMGGGKDIADIEAVVDVVAYADGTADVQNDRAFNNLMALRKGQLMAMQKMTEVAKNVLADPMASSPIAEALRELTPFVSDAPQNRPPEDPELQKARSLSTDVRFLQAVQKSQMWLQMKMTEREWLTQYVERQEKVIALTAPHCALVLNK